MRERNETILWLKSGRLALYHLLKHISTISNRRKILLPAYHCNSMIDPCLWAGFQIGFYRINADLSPDSDHLVACLTDDTAAVVFVHFFGFPCQLEDVANVCRDAGVPIIEDACHIDCTNGASRNSVGRFGRWLFSSPRKFYDIFDGGYLEDLTSSGMNVSSLPRSSSLRDELRAMKHSMEWTLGKRSTVPANSAALLAPFINTREYREPPVTGNKEIAYQDPRFVPSNKDSMSYYSRMRLLVSSPVQNSRVRRRNYCLLTSVLKNSSRCDLLHEELPDDASPYVCPVILRYPETDHTAFRTSGVNVLRWEKLATTICPTSSYFEQHLIQVPLVWSTINGDEDRLMRVLRKILQIGSAV